MLTCWKLLFWPRCVQPTCDKSEDWATGRDVRLGEMWLDEHFGPYRPRGGFDRVSVYLNKHSQHLHCAIASGRIRLRLCIVIWGEGEIIQQSIEWRGVCKCFLSWIMHSPPFYFGRTSNCWQFPYSSPILG